MIRDIFTVVVFILIFIFLGSELTKIQNEKYDRYCRRTFGKSAKEVEEDNKENND